MYKIIIADDESNVREKILLYVEKNKDNFEVIGSYKNGYDALISGVPLKPDLIITDIRMPFISGIELIKEAKTQLPLVQSIIISGYDSFDYAKKAIQLGAIDYLSKPVTLQELTETLTKAKIALDSNRQKDTKLERIDDIASRAIVENDLSKLISLKEVSKDFNEKLLTDKINIRTNYKMISTIDFDKDLIDVSTAEIDLLSSYAFKYIKFYFANKNIKTYVFTERNQVITVILSEYQLLLNEVTDLYKLVVAKILEATSMNISIGLSSIAEGENFSNFNALFLESLKALEYRTIIGNGSVLSYKDICVTTKTQDITIDDSIFNNISYEMLYSSCNKVKASIFELLNKISNEKYKDSYFGILDNLLNVLLKTCLQIDVLYNEFMPHLDLVEKVMKAKNTESLRGILNKLVDVIFKINENSKLSGIESSFLQIQKYIETNYNKSTLSLDDVGEELNYSVSYVSAILKKHDTSFTKYLTDIRMEKARNLVLNSNDKLISIANEVGYEDPYYFSHCFKKYYGASPLEYKKNEA